jgi:hypothetical protein
MSGYRQWGSGLRYAWGREGEGLLWQLQGNLYLPVEEAYASIFFSGPVEAEGVTNVAAPAGWLFWNLMAHPILGKGESTSPPRWL